MISRRSLWCAIPVLLFTLTSFSAASPADKIAPRVMSETANGGRTEALVVLGEQADLTHAAALGTKAEKGRYVVDALRAVAARTQGPIIQLLRQRGIPYQPFFIVNMIKISGTRGLMEELAARNDVSEIDANPYVRTALPVPTRRDPNPQPDTIEWNVKMVKAPQVWKMGYRGEGLVVSGADTGVQWDHPALKKQYRGWNGHSVDHDYNWHDAVDNQPAPFDPFGHGTFTVGEMVGDDGKGNKIGVAPHAQWIACRNMDENGTGSPARYSECFEFLIAPYPVGGGQGDPSKAPDSVNNSWICPDSEGCSVNTLKKVVNAVRAAGIFPAMAAGNSGSNCSSIDTPPAIYKSAVTVGAIDSGKNIASFSSRGPVTSDGSNRRKPDLSAPGVDLRGAVPGSQYESGWSGTSMAAPHVAGGVALLWQAKPSLVGDIDTTEHLFDHTADHLVSTQNCGGSGQHLPNNIFGWGMINLYKAATAP